MKTIKKLAIIFIPAIILVAFTNLSLWYWIPIYLLYFVALFFIFRTEIDAVIANYNYAIGHGDRAEGLFEKVTNKNCKNAITYLNYAIMLSHKNEGLKALSLLEKAEKLSPNVMTKKNILLTRATCYWTVGEIDKGINELKNLLNNYDYANPNALTTLGFLYILKEDYDKALKYTNKALEDDPNYVLAYDNLGQIDFRLEKYNSAINHFEKVIDKYSYPDSLYYLGLIHIKQGDDEKAKLYLDKASKCNITALNTITFEDITEALNSLK